MFIGQKGISGTRDPRTLYIPAVLTGHRKMAAANILPADGSQLFVHNQPRTDARTDCTAQCSAYGYSEVISI